MTCTSESVGAGATDLVQETTTRQILTSSELWGTLRPSAIVSDLRGGVNVFRAPGLYETAPPGLHVARPVDVVSNPFVEARTAVSTTWSQNRTAAIFQALGSEGAARDAALLAQSGDPANAWLIATGATQVGELALAGRDTVGLANP